MECVEVFIKKEYSDEEVYTDVYAALIDKKDAAQVLEQFCSDIPLQNYGLNHLKRIQPLNRGDKQSQLQIIVCPAQRFDDIPEHIRSKCTSKVTIKVCKLAPACRAEFEAWNQCWPINFHASHLEKEREKGLCAEDFAQVKMAEKALAAEEALLPYGGGVIVNPENGRIICSTSEAKTLLWRRFSAAEESSVASTKAPADAAQLTPSASALCDALYTPTMLCIHGVAAVLRGEMPDRSDSLPENAYLCSGFDLYLTHEPDLMSSMALVHSRIRRVFFRNADGSTGALLSGRGHIHCLRSLNHNYRVFQMFKREDSS